MEKITPDQKKLTSEQEALLAVVRDEWIKLAIGGDTEIALEPATAGVHWMYKAAGLAPPKEVVVCDSPKAAVKAARDAGATDVRNTDYLGLGYWAGWHAFYDFWGRCGLEAVQKNEGLKVLADFMRAGVWDTVLRENVAFLSRRPCVVKKDNAERPRLHCADGPAVAFRDGFALYRWHGTTVPKKAILSPGEIKKEDLAKVTNSETTRALIEILGIGRYAEVLGVVTVDSWTDPKTGLAYELLDFAERTTEDQPRLLKMQSPVLRDGTQPTYIEAVDVELTTAQAARKWQFKGEDGRYPSVEECNNNPELVFGVER